LTARLILFWLLFAAAGLPLVTAVIRQQDVEGALRQSVAVAGPVAGVWAARFDNNLEPRLALDAMPGLADGLAPLVNARTGTVGAAIILTNGKPAVQIGKAALPTLASGLADGLFGPVRQILLGQFKAPSRIVTAGGVIYVSLHDWTGLTRGALVLAQDIRPVPQFMPWREGIGVIAMACLLAVLPLRRIARRWWWPTALAGLLGIAIFGTALSGLLLREHVPLDLLARTLAEGACIAFAAALAFSGIGLAFVQDSVRTYPRNRAGAAGKDSLRLLAGCCLAVPWPSLLGTGGTVGPWLCILVQVTGIIFGAKTAVMVMERYGWRAAGLPGAVCGIAGSGLLMAAGHPAITLAAWTLLGFGGGLVMAALHIAGQTGGGAWDRVLRFLSAFKGPAAGLALAFAVNGAFGATATAVSSLAFWALTGLVIASRPNDRTAALRFLLNRPDQPPRPALAGRVRSLVQAVALVPQAVPLAVAQMLLLRASFPFDYVYLR
jgi:hypothetical protein